MRNTVQREMQTDRENLLPGLSELFSLFTLQSFVLLFFPETHMNFKLKFKWQLSRQIFSLAPLRFALLRKGINLGG